MYRHIHHGGPDPTSGQWAGLGAIAGLIGAFVGAVVFASTSFISMLLFARLADYLRVEGNLPFRTGAQGAVLASTFGFVLDVALYPPNRGRVRGNITGGRELLRGHAEGPDLRGF